jgi:hypothetical protein
MGRVGRRSRTHQRTRDDSDRRDKEHAARDGEPAERRRYTEADEQRDGREANDDATTRAG